MDMPELKLIAAGKFGVEANAKNPMLTDKEGHATVYGVYVKMSEELGGEGLMFTVSLSYTDRTLTPKPADSITYEELLAALPSGIKIPGCNGNKDFNLTEAENPIGTTLYTRTKVFANKTDDKFTRRFDIRFVGFTPAAVTASEPEATTQSVKAAKASTKKAPAKEEKVEEAPVESK